MKRNKNKVILSSIVVLLPMVIGLLIWNQLPNVAVKLPALAVEI